MTSTPPGPRTCAGPLRDVASRHSRERLSMTRSSWRAVPLAVISVLALAGPAAAQDVVVSGSPASPFPQNKQNEPSVAVDPLDPSILIAGSNDELDESACSGSDCSFVTGIGNSGVYFSTTGGTSWTQPTYHGFTGRGRGGAPGADRTGVQGDIGTLPNYAEAGLVSDGDPAVAFGPRFAHGAFSYDNGEQAYYADLTSNFSGGAMPSRTRSSRTSGLTAMRRSVVRASDRSTCRNAAVRAGPKYPRST